MNPVPRALGPGVHVIRTAWTSRHPRSGGIAPPRIGYGTWRARRTVPCRT